MKIKDCSILVPVLVYYDKEDEESLNVSEIWKVFLLDYSKMKLFHLDGTEITGDFKNKVFNYINKTRKPAEVPDAPNSGWNMKI